MITEHTTKPTFYSTGIEEAERLDREDQLSHFREQFHFPKGENGEDLIYLCGNSLGLQPKGAQDKVMKEMRDWKELGVKGHFTGTTPWTTFHELVNQPMADIVGAKPEEVVVMNTLTVNLHLMMVSFYRPTENRYKILMEKEAFPSDKYAVQSQLKFHGYGIDDGIIEIEARDGEKSIRLEDLLDIVDKRGDEIALIILGNPNYFTGEVFDMKAITEAGHKKGCMVGFDCAHGAGNIILNLHNTGADFAVWCTYKYMNSGPGSLGGVFVHERHLKDNDIPKLAGWWGQDKARRFLMEDEFHPSPTVESWQMSNAPILSFAPMIASVELFSEAGMHKLRSKAIQLTSYLEFLINSLNQPAISIITPEDPQKRGCQLSIRIKDGDKKIYHKIRESGVILDWREPNIIRAAPTPLYNSYRDVYEFIKRLNGILEYN
ncbi:MAG: kynureninase [Saprospiraceae bacterium]|nr:kynureninase [Saprospiraceae bacterium]